MSVFQLTYSSTVRDGIRALDLENLIRQAREHNQKRGITGLLLFNGQCFVQLIEGRESDVRSVYRTICDDSRHHDVTLLAESRSTARRFPAWRMVLHEGDIAAMQAHLARVEAAPAASSAATSA